MRQAGLVGSFWPSAQQQLLLHTVLDDPVHAADAWRRLRPAFDLDRLEEGSFRLVPLLYKRLEEFAGDDPLLPRLKGIYRRTWYANQLLLDHGAGALEALGAHGVEVVVAEDVALVLRYYGDAGLRAATALHLLVPRAHAREAERGLRSAGWRGERASASRTRSSGPLVDEDGHQCFLRRLLLPEFALGDERDAWREAGEVSLGKASAGGLAATDELLVVCAEGARNSGWANVHWVADALTIMRSGHELDWPGLVAWATSHRATLRLRDSLAYLAREFDAPVPVDALDELASVPVTRRERGAHRLSGSSGRGGRRAPESLARYLRVSSDTGAVRALAGLPAFLRDEWDLEQRTQVPLAATRRLGRRLVRRP